MRAMQNAAFGGINIHPVNRLQLKPINRAGQAV